MGLGGRQRAPPLALGHAANLPRARHGWRGAPRQALGAHRACRSATWRGPVAPGLRTEGGERVAELFRLLVVRGDHAGERQVNADQLDLARSGGRVEPLQRGLRRPLQPGPSGTAYGMPPSQWRDTHGRGAGRQVRRFRPGQPVVGPVMRVPMRAPRSPHRRPAVRGTVSFGAARTRWEAVVAAGRR